MDLACLPETERRDAVVSGIARTLGDRAARPLDYVDWRWTEEPWSRGCYSSYATPGAWTSTGPALRAPIGRVHWAGSDTAGEWVGFMDGAISSGRRVAEEIAATA
jgi:monoamine oxidase